VCVCVCVCVCLAVAVLLVQSTGNKSDLKKFIMCLPASKLLVLMLYGR